MMNRECRMARDCFVASEEGALRADEAAALRAHLGACEDCRQAWERWRADDRALHAALTPLPAPRDFAGAVVGELRRTGARPAVVKPRGMLRWAAVGAAAAVVLVAGGWVLFARRYEKIGQVALIEGRVMARQRGASKASVLAAGATIYNGDELIADEASRLAVELYDRSRLMLGERSGVRLHSGTGDEEHDCNLGLSHVCLGRGEVECDVASLRYFRAVGTPLGTAIVHGTRFRMKYVAGDRVLLEVLEGEVLFSCPKGQVQVTPGAIWEVRDAVGLPQRSLIQTWK